MSRETGLFTPVLWALEQSFFCLTSRGLGQIGEALHGKVLHIILMMVINNR
ncbi:hypothetical protein [Paenibacillus plantiphilus]|uniref:hypothetical protein n=1 Tax=Paenibacillus plantiphilus TaxID=2905650 RepID=UPI001F45301A|nr:hypothetical protein [Paenibacillus plantiphilus]